MLENSIIWWNLDNKMLKNSPIFKWIGLEMWKNSSIFSRISYYLHLFDQEMFIYLPEMYDFWVKIQ